MTYPVTQTGPTMDSGSTFDKIIWSKKGCTVNGETKDIKTIDLAGSLVFTQDTTVTGPFHVLIHFAQRLYFLLFGHKNKPINPFLMHGMIILNRQDDGKILYAHSSFGGIKTGCKKYLDEPDVTELVIYRPKDDALRGRISTLARQSAYVPPKHRSGQKGLDLDAAGRFSYLDNIRSFFIKKQYPVIDSQRIKKRLSHAVDDLYHGRTILNRKGKPRDFFCTPYVLTILQAAVLLQNLSDEDAKAHPNDLANHVFTKLNNSDDNDPIRKCFLEHSFMQLDGRFTMTAYAARVLDGSTG